MSFQVLSSGSPQWAGSREKSGFGADRKSGIDEQVHWKGIE